MSTATAPFTLGLHAEPIPGYVLQERIGSGGAGEVWRVEAPGGLQKAMKFVYGRMDEKRATQELRSLNRIKEVHHPFLLSLDRIEIVDGQLMIVSELADSCLKARFDHCREEGLDGIPREELLRYLREAADVLDFIYAKHSLQHLDVKPENLLLVGNHIKVADFGLLKNVNEVSESMIGGLTPLYAPPEVLCGRPGRFSDQYSLAIVFQEMLTGQTPFAGRNTAQLAAQHLHSAPNISALPPSDQAVIARALSKKPEARFASCQALIEALEAPSRTVVVSSSAARSRPAETARVAKTEMLDGMADTTLDNEPRSLMPTVEAEHLILDRVVVADPQPALAPTLFVSVGGAGAKVLTHLVQRLNRVWGNLRDVPAVQMVMLDTDIESLSDPGKTSVDVAAYGVNVVATPLRPSKEYRTESDKLLSWISRRWLFNIPRTQRTEGMRPLGRLAFVDHYQTICDRLRKAIRAAVSTQSIAASSQHTGAEFQSVPPRVFVVASTAGGTGGGMVLDLSYAVRNLLLELGLPDENVCGVLLHSTNRHAGQRDLAIVNTCATLSEMQHYCRVGSFYPGDAACDLPAFDDNHATFHDAYLIHLGDGLSENEYDGAIDRVAEYLFHNVATSAANVFDACRRLEHEETPSPLSKRLLRTVNLQRHTASLESLRQVEESQLCLELIQSWLPATAAVSQLGRNRNAAVATAAATEYMKHVGMSASAIEANVQESLTQITKMSFTQLIEKLVSQMTEAAGETLNRVELFAAIDTMFQQPESRGVTNLSRALHTSIVERLRPAIQQQGAELKMWLLQLLEVPGLRIQGVTNATKCVATHLEAIQNQARSQIEKADAAVRELQTLPPQGVALPELLTKYAELRWGQLQNRMVQVWVAGIMTYANNTLGEMRLLSDKVTQLLAASQNMSRLHAGTNDPVPPAADEAWNAFVHSLRQDTPALIGQMDDDINARLANEAMSFASSLQHANSTRLLLELVAKAAAKTMRGAMQGFEQTSAADLALVEKINERYRTMAPKFQDCGGASRLILIAPAETNPCHVAAELETMVEQPVTLVAAETDAYVLCEEVERVPLENILANLIGPRQDYIEASRRLYTRMDVNWSLV